MKPKNHAEATRNYLEYELEENFLITISKP